MGKVIDSLTGVEFNSYQEYLDHVSPVTGYRPTDPEHQGKTGLLIAKQALKRTNSLGAEAEAKVDANLANVEASGIQKKIDVAARKVNTRKVNTEIMT